MPTKFPIIETPFDDPREAKEYTPEHFSVVQRVLRRVHLPEGLGEGVDLFGDRKATACSIAAINLALTGQMTDNIPACMDSWLGNWIINVQDQLDDKTRNSVAWRRLLPYAAGTAGSKTSTIKRQKVYNEYVWTVVLPLLVTPRIKNTQSAELLALWEKLLKQRRLTKSDSSKWRTLAHLASDRLDELEDYLGGLDKETKIFFRDSQFLGDLYEVYPLLAADSTIDRAKTWKKLDPARLLEKMIVVGGYKKFPGVPELAA